MTDLNRSQLLWETSSARSLDQCFPQIPDWIDECTQRHHVCCENLLPESSTPLPKRLLRVPSNGDGEISLIRSEGMFGHYAALSHCWGGQSTLVTTESNIEKLMKGIELDLLPQNYQQAIALTRRLKISYLWIDSLCIIQDSDHDWKHQAAKMADIYSNAFITIAAASAHKANDGFFGNSTCPQQLAIEDLPGKVFVFGLQDYARIPNTALNNRGWVLQEWILSPRVIHFAEDQMYWECTSRFASQNKLLDFYLTHSENPEYAAVEEIYMSIRIRGAMTGRLRTWNKIYSIWSDLVEQYSRRLLTYKTDKFAALAGLTTSLSRRLNDIPLVGLWRADIHLGLLWSVESYESILSSVMRGPFSYKPPQWREALPDVPSWSWVSVDTPVYYNIRSTPKTLHRASLHIPLCEHHRELENHPSAQFSNSLEVIEITQKWADEQMTSKLTSTMLRARCRIRMVHGGHRGLHKCDICFVSTSNDYRDLSDRQTTFFGRGTQNTSAASAHEFMCIPPIVAVAEKQYPLTEVVALVDGQEMCPPRLRGRISLDRPLPEDENLCIIVILVTTELTSNGLEPFADHVIAVRQTGRYLNEFKRIGSGVFWTQHGIFKDVGFTDIDLV